MDRGGRAPVVRNGGVVVLAAALALALPSPVPARWHAPKWWLPGALCIHRHEGAFNANTGNGYYGGFQFLLSTWQSVGGHVRPDLASPREQLYRAWLVYRRDGNSWREWGTATLCGLR